MHLLTLSRFFVNQPWGLNTLISSIQHKITEMLNLDVQNCTPTSYSVPHMDRCGRTAHPRVSLRPRDQQTPVKNTQVLHLSRTSSHSMKALTNYLRLFYKLIQRVEICQLFLFEIETLYFRTRLSCSDSVSSLAVCLQ